ncbi:hypothetical protein [Amycolatopsis sp. NPDC098790]|uniref:hypothetical protein n=1 Tax=Amycolatopsis sp. NPDC098790 TaxID=3363939 RepID=UPI00380EA85C
MSDETLWWTAIAAGFVVVLAVAALLGLLIRSVRVVDERVAGIRDTLHAAASNTRDTALIAETAGRVDGVLAEGLRHHLFLGRAKS